MTDQPITETWAPVYQRRPDESYADFVARIRAAGRPPYFVEDPKPGTGRPMGRPRKEQL